MPKAFAIAVLISIHAPRKGERLLGTGSLKRRNQDFNPRSPQGGATALRDIFGAVDVISIHAPRKGERRRYAFAPFAIPHISIHAPRKGERRLVAPVAQLARYISIHAPRKGERPGCHFVLYGVREYFNPRSPQGGATESGTSTIDIHTIFQSTLPARGSDGATTNPNLETMISIHAPRKGERLLLLELMRLTH